MFKRLLDGLFTLLRLRKWHFRFSEVRAYQINWDDKSHEAPIFDGKDVNPTRTPIAGIKLNAEQILTLQEAVYGNHPDHPVAMCFLPHHAFLFFNTDGTIVGHIDLCFLCSNYRSFPKGFANTWNLNLLAELVTQLEMPISNPNWNT